MLVVTFDGQTFSFAFDIADPAQFSALLREILDWRMAQYWSRTGTAEGPRMLSAGSHKIPPVTRSCSYHRRTQEEACRRGH